MDAGVQGITASLGFQKCGCTMCTRLFRVLPGHGRATPDSSTHSENPHSLRPLSKDVAAAAIGTKDLLHTDPVAT